MNRADLHRSVHHCFEPGGHLTAGVPQDAHLWAADCLDPHAGPNGRRARSPLLHECYSQRHHTFTAS